MLFRSILRDRALSPDGTRDVRPEADACPRRKCGLGRARYSMPTSICWRENTPSQPHRQKYRGRNNAIFSMDGTADGRLMYIEGFGRLCLGKCAQVAGYIYIYIYKLDTQVEQTLNGHSFSLCSKYCFHIFSYD